jgi:hypothetical protein
MRNGFDTPSINGVNCVSDANGDGLSGTALRLDIGQLSCSMNRQCSQQQPDASRALRFRSGGLAKPGRLHMAPTQNHRRNQPCARLPLRIKGTDKRPQPAFGCLASNSTDAALRPFQRSLRQPSTYVRPAKRRFRIRSIPLDTRAGPG